MVNFVMIFTTVKKKKKIRDFVSGVLDGLIQALHFMSDRTATPEDG